jgi:Mg2+ and Co2+ transporter CorA
MKYSDARTLTAEVVVSIYIFLGRGWLVTIHSAKVDLMSTTVYTGFWKKKPANTEVVHRRAVLHNNILSSIIDRYEQLLTAIELSVTDNERKSIYRPSKKMLEYLVTTCQDRL